MPKSSSHLSRLVTHLQASGPSQASELVKRLGVSQPTLSRLISEMGPHCVHRIGAARSTRYALRKKVRQFGDEWPLYRVSERGVAEPWGMLLSLHGGFQVVCAKQPEWATGAYPNGLYSGLPFFLQDVRPQGYLGRAVARRLSGQAAFPREPDNWSDDDTLAYFLLEGDDLPGDFVVGDATAQRVHRSARADRDTVVSESERAAIYPTRVEAAHRAEFAGSSAGGDQPKFLCNVGDEAGTRRPVLVKFSPPMESPGARRWADLLVCEHLASEVVSTHGIPSARTEILDTGNRRYLEVERFDRTIGGGRRGTLTLGAIEDAFLDEVAYDWTQAAVALTRQGWIVDEDARRLRWAACFGELIGNSDMHRANASFWFTDTLPFRLAPIYDMLPMAFRPNGQGEVVIVQFEAGAQRVASRDVWRDASSAAVEFWNIVSVDPRVSEPFRKIARECLLKVEQRVAGYR